MELSYTIYHIPCRRLQVVTVKKWTMPVRNYNPYSVTYKVLLFCFFAKGIVHPS